ncbi:hypothetical protein B0H11DRAFT_2244998 [Mycena galericulata]|nr:hypothetical protein B0H11DRAFT_2244998 [Mycena galericulata]
MANIPGPQVNPLLVTDSPCRAQVSVGQGNMSGSGNAAGSSSTVNPQTSQADRDAARRVQRDTASRARHPVPLPAPVAPTFRGGTRIVRGPSPTSVAVLGRRPEREEPLRDTDLYKDGSHPVSYLCGHSHCYACIRVWLEKRWTCPECVTPMHRAPFRHYGEEAYIADAYPEWKDGSEVNYSFEGLVFPKRPRRVVVDISDFSS